MPKFCTSEDQTSKPESSSAMRKSVNRCFECEIFFQPNVPEQRFCTDCAMGKPFVKKTVDRVYLDNMNNSVLITNPTINEKDLMTNNPATKRPVHDKETVEVINNKRLKLSSADSNSKETTEKHGEKPNKPKEVFSFQTKKVPIPNNSQSSVNPINILKINNNLAVQSASQLKTSKLNKLNLKMNETGSSDGSKEKLNQSRESPSNLNPKEKEVIDATEIPVKEKVNLDEEKVSSLKPEVIPTTETSLDSVPVKSQEVSLKETNSLANISNLIVPTNSELSKACLDALKSKEKELAEMIDSLTSDQALKEGALCAKNLTELKLKVVEEQQVLSDKEAALRDLELQAKRLLLLINTCKREKDFLTTYLEEALASLERAKSSLAILETQLLNSEKEYITLEDKDSELLELLSNSLAKKEKRVKTTKAEIARYSNLHAETEEDFRKTEEVLDAKGSIYKKVLENIDKEKSELESLQTGHASTEKDIALYDSQLKGVPQENKKKLSELFELEQELLEIEYHRKRKELDFKKQTIQLLLSLTN